MFKFTAATLLVAAVSSIEVFDDVPAPEPAPVEEEPKTGAFTKAGEPSAEAEALIMTLQSAIEEKAGEEYTEFVIISVSTQIVAGVNYNCTIGTDKGIIYASIFDPLPYLKQPAIVKEVTKTVHEKSGVSIATGGDHKVADDLPFDLDEGFKERHVKLHRPAYGGYGHGRRGHGHGHRGGYARGPVARRGGYGGHGAGYGRHGGYGSRGSGYGGRTARHGSYGNRGGYNRGYGGYGGRGAGYGRQGINSGYNAGYGNKGYGRGGYGHGRRGGHGGYNRGYGGYGGQGASYGGYNKGYGGRGGYNRGYGGRGASYGRRGGY